MPVESWIPITIGVVIVSCIMVLSIVYAFWPEILRKMKSNHSKKNITSDTCVICGAPRKWLHRKLEWEECLICTKAKKIINLDDLRIWNNKQKAIPTEQQSLVKAINFFQNRDKPKTSFFQPTGRGTIYKSEEEQKLYKYWDDFKGRYELPRWMTKEQADMYIKLKNEQEIR